MKITRLKEVWSKDQSRSRLATCLGIWDYYLLPFLCSASRCYLLQGLRSNYPLNNGTCLRGFLWRLNKYEIVPGI